MANISLTSDDAKNLTAFLTWVKDVDTNGWPPKPLSVLQKDSHESNVNGFGATIDRGIGVFDSEGCSGCHRINGIGGNIGPDLTKIGNARDKEWLKNFLQNPQNVKPNTMMPAPNIPGEEMDALVDYLAGLK